MYAFVFVWYLSIDLQYNSMFYSSLTTAMQTHPSSDHEKMPVSYQEASFSRDGSKRSHPGLGILTNSTCRNCQPQKPGRNQRGRWFDGTDQRCQSLGSNLNSGLQIRCFIYNVTLKAFCVGSSNFLNRNDWQLWTLFDRISIHCWATSGADWHPWSSNGDSKKKKKKISFIINDYTYSAEKLHLTYLLIFGDSKDKLHTLN